uniref:Uncharacterized protein n=1 Tax=Timema tahoe TaxID=61484 RepID=A0A7R9INA6_9NEOP|nr:unnamed protein product [Timema tahoe]
MEIPPNCPLEMEAPARNKERCKLDQWRLRFRQLDAVVTDVLGRNMYRVSFKEGLGQTRHIDQLRKRYERTPQPEDASERPLSQVEPARYPDKDLVTHHRARPLQQPLPTPAREDHEQQPVENPQTREQQPAALIDSTGQQPEALIDNTGFSKEPSEKNSLLNPYHHILLPILVIYLSTNYANGLRIWKDVFQRKLTRIC